MEADLQTQASEMKYGFTRKYEDSKWSRRDWKNNKSYGASLQDGKKTGNEIERKGKPCRACGEAHHLEKCKVFSGWSTEKKWEAAKRFGVCYRCLNDDHLGNQCPKSKACDVTGCKVNISPSAARITTPAGIKDTKHGGGYKWSNHDTKESKGTKRRSLHFEQFLPLLNTERDDYW